jgi:uncharacterized membrane protein
LRSGNWQFAACLLDGLWLRLESHSLISLCTLGEHSTAMKTIALPVSGAEGLTEARSEFQPAQMVFAVGMIAMGLVAIVYGDFAMVWQPVPAWVPGRTSLAYGSGVLMAVCGTALLFPSSVWWAVRILFPYLIVWALLKVPAVLVAPQIVGVWLGLGELTALLSGGWVLFARYSGLDWRFLTGERGVKWASVLFGISLLPIGLSHLVYLKETTAYVPAWLPYRMGWAILTGVGQIACGLGVLTRILPKVAATAEAIMISLFTLLCWGPVILETPKIRLGWTAFFISWAIASAAWVVAERQ